VFTLAQVLALSHDVGNLQLVRDEESSGDAPVFRKRGVLRASSSGRIVKSGDLQLAALPSVNQWHEEADEEEESSEEAAQRETAAELKQDDDESSGDMPQFRKVSVEVCASEPRAEEASLLVTPTAEDWRKGPRPQCSNGGSEDQGPRPKCSSSDSKNAAQSCAVPSHR
jgi:hypothetical protein